MDERPSKLAAMCAWAKHARDSVYALKFGRQENHDDLQARGEGPARGENVLRRGVQEVQSPVDGQPEQADNAALGARGERVGHQGNSREVAYPEWAVALRYEQQSADIDLVLDALGIGVERGRTECGYLNVPRILRHIRETHEALAEASNRAQAFAEKYAKVSRIGGDA